MRDDLMTMLIAGHETTAAVCTWTLFCLMQDEEAEAKALAEIDAVVGDRVPSEWRCCCCWGWHMLWLRCALFELCFGCALPWRSPVPFPECLTGLFFFPFTCLQRWRTLGSCPTCAWQLWRACGCTPSRPSSSAGKPAGGRGRRAGWLGSWGRVGPQPAFLHVAAFPPCPHCLWRSPFITPSTCCAWPHCLPALAAACLPAYLSACRRSLADDVLPAGLGGDPSGYPIGKGADLFISLWNLHR